MPLASSRVKIGLVQMSVPPHRDEALKKASRLVAEAANKGAKIVCLPELFATPYFPQKQDNHRDGYAESVDGKSARIISALAKKLGVVIIAPIYERSKKGKYFNTALVFDDRGRRLGSYRKNHIPEDPGFYEKEYFEAGDSGYKVFATRFGKFAVLICYDQWYPEAARMARLMGAEIIFYPTGLGYILNYKPEGDWHDAWETVQRGHAIANSLYVAAVNRVGREGNMKFFGQSFVCGPFGEIIKRAGRVKDEVLVANLDFKRNSFFSQGWGFLRNRRPDTYKLSSTRFVEHGKKLKAVAHYKEMRRALRQNHV